MSAPSSPAVSRLAGRRHAALLLCASAFLAAGCAGGPLRGDPLQSPTGASAEVEFLHYAIDLELRPVSRSIDALCRVVLRSREQAVEEVRLALEGLDVHRVRDHRERGLEWIHQGGELVIQLAETLPPGDRVELLIEYGGRPVQGLRFAGEAGGVATHAYSQGFARESSSWFPCWDAPGVRATSEVRVTMPVEWVAVAAGERVERLEQGRFAIEHWRSERTHPVALTCLAAGDFALLEEQRAGLPLTALAPRAWAGQLAATFAGTAAALDHLEELTGLPYPSPRYSQVCVENFPLVERGNASSSTLSARVLGDELTRRDRDPHELVVRAAARQWFGDLLSIASWEDLWLEEGLAEYAAILFLERTRGVDELRARMDELHGICRELDRSAERRPVVWGVYRDPSDLLDERVRAGGAARLHLLRYVLGDDAFFDGLRTFAAEHRGGEVSTADLQRALEKVSGRELGVFFEQWLRSPGLPEFEVRSSWDAGAGQLLLTVEQRQSTLGGVPDVFRLPVEVEIRDAGGVALHRLELEQRKQTFSLPARMRPEMVRFDKYGWIPKHLSFERTPEQWLAILTLDDDVNGRRDALVALGQAVSRERDTRRDLFVGEIANSLRTDSSPHVRTAAAAALGAVRGEEAREVLMLAAGGDAAPEVRIAALSALEAWGVSPEHAAFALVQYEAGYSYDTMVAAASLGSAADPLGAYAFLTRQLLRESPHDCLRAGLMAELAQVNSPAVVDQLLRWARDRSASAPARRAAVEALGLRGQGRLEVRETLIAMLGAENLDLRAAAIEALGELGDAPSRQALQAHYDGTVFPRERRAIEAAFDRRP